MRLRMTNGYPYPYPQGLSEAEQDEINDRAAGEDLLLDGVNHFEWLHTVTVEFDNVLSLLEAQGKTGWQLFGSGHNCILEAPTSLADGYGHPAIIVGDRAYCGFILEGT